MQARRRGEPSARWASDDPGVVVPHALRGALHHWCGWCRHSQEPIELALNAANLALVAFGQRTGNPDGQVLVFFVMAVAAAEVAVGLAIIVAIFRVRQRLSVDELSVMRW